MEERSILEEIEGIEEPIKNEGIEVTGADNKINLDMGFLATKTGAGGIEEYIEHPLNFNKGKGMAQIIRGFTGLFGALDLAIIDILVGILQVSKEKKKEVVANVNQF